MASVWGARIIGKSRLPLAHHVNHFDAVDVDAIRAAMARKCLSNEGLCNRKVTVLAEEEFYRVANTVDDTVEIHPFVAHLDVSFVKVLSANYSTLALVETLQQLGE